MVTVTSLGFYPNINAFAAHLPLASVSSSLSTYTPSTGAAGTPSQTLPTIKVYREYSMSHTTTPRMAVLTSTSAMSEMVSTLATTATIGTTVFVTTYPPSSMRIMMASNMSMLTGMIMPSSSPSLTASMSTPANVTAVEDCLTEMGGVQSDKSVQPGCAALLAHLESCYDANSPIINPYDDVQNSNFQSCICETSKSEPFSDNSNLWQNFTGCSTCLLGFKSGISVGTLSQELEQIDNFCCSQNPNAYMAITDFVQWLQSLLNNITLPQPAVTGSITEITSVSSEFTTTPPLANLAYGASAPFDGSLQGVTPEMMTQIVTQTSTGSSTTSIWTESITMLVQWVPTSIAPGGTPIVYNPSDASMVAASLASASLESAISALETVGQGGPTGPRCIGPCLKGHSGASRFSAQTLANAVLVASLVLSVLVL